MSCTARQPGLVVLTTSELEFAGMTGSSLVMRRCSCTWPVAGSRSMSVSLRSMLPPLGFRLTEMNVGYVGRSEEHTSELQSPMYLVCRLLLEKKKKKIHKKSVDMTQHK